VRQVKVCGDDLISIDIVNRGKRAAIARNLRDSGAWIECVEGMSCVVVRFDSATTSASEARQQLAAQLRSDLPRRRFKSTSIEIPVCYGGACGSEFESICEMLGLTADEVIRIHTSREHRVDLIGFTPGFAYLSGLRDDLRIPRLTDPRQRAAAGSVGIAAGLTGLYATAGPAGWPLIGRTPMPLLIANAQAPFVLTVGMRVRFTAIDEQAFHRLAEK
jgi:allophanate hydrolase